MSAFRNVTQGFRNLWGHGGDDEEEYEVAEETEEIEATPTSSREHHSRTEHGSDREVEPRSFERRVSAGHGGSSPGGHSAYESEERYTRFTTPVGASAPSSSPSRPSYSPEPSVGAPGPGGRSKLRPVSMPLRAREKNIYTLKPKSMDEASLAADYLKTGCAVVVNLEEVERTIAVRIIDFMSGICYGLEHQGHAMKLGDTIFLFTPGDFEISSDEADYGENRDFIFKDVTHDTAKTALPGAVPEAVAGERRSWER